MIETTSMNTDYIIQGIILVCMLAAFIGMTAWAWSSKRRDDFEFMSRLPLDEGSENTSDTK